MWEWFICLIVGFIFLILLLLCDKVRNKHCHTHVKKESPLEDENEFLIMLSEKYDTYEDFLVSRDFDDYFSWWNDNPQKLDLLKKMIEDSKTNIFKYKKVTF